MVEHSPKILASDEKATTAEREKERERERQRQRDRDRDRQTDRVREEALL